MGAVRNPARVAVMRWGKFMRPPLMRCKIRAGQEGFTLLELMIVVLIIALLSLYALPAYNAYVTKSATKSCLSEAKGYMNSYHVAIAQSETPATYTASACLSGATEAGVSLSFAAKLPSTATITCMKSTGVCLVP